MSFTHDTSKSKKGSTFLENRAKNLNHRRETAVEKEFSKPFWQ